MQPTIGRTLIYKLSMNDAARINAQLVGFSGSSFATKCGNSTSAGAEFPLVVTRVLPAEGGPGILDVNGQVLFDGNGTLWVTYVHEGTVPGTWHWPVRD